MTAAWRRLGRLDRVGDVGHRAAKHPLLRLRRAVYDHDRAVGAVLGLELSHQLAGPGDRQVQHQCRTGRGECPERLRLRHLRRALPGAGEHHGLSDQRDGQFTADARGGGGVGRYSRRHGPGHPGIIEPSGLLGHRRIHRRISRHQAHHASTGAVPVDQLADDGVEIQMFGVDQFGVRCAVREDSVVEVGARDRGRCRLANIRAARTVSRSAAPGPAPTNCTAWASSIDPQCKRADEASVPQPPAAG